MALGGWRGRWAECQPGRVRVRPGMSLQLKATCLGAESGPGSWEGEPSLEPAPQGSQDRGRSLGEAGWGRSHRKCHFWDTPEWSQPRMELMAWGEQHMVGPGVAAHLGLLSRGGSVSPQGSAWPSGDPDSPLDASAQRQREDQEGRVGAGRTAGEQPGASVWLPQWLRGGQGPMDG